MAREIKFRGKRVDNGDWVIGDLIQLSDGRKFIVDNHFGACIDDKGNFINTESPFVNKVIPETVGQYTGLKDKDDNEIWEGDIVKWGHLPGSYEHPLRIAVVEFKPDIQFRPINLKNNRPFYYGNFAYRDTEKYLEILGNIFENPELLEDGK